MKFDVKTLDVLKNFYTINPGIKFTKGKILKTVSPLSKSILAKAYITDEIEAEFCIGELNKFMSVLSLFGNPEITFGDTSCIIKGNNNRVEYVYTAENFMTVAPDKEPKLTNCEVQFTFTNENFQEVRKAMAILQSDLMVVVGDGKQLSIQTRDSKNVVKDRYTLTIGETSHNCELVIKGEHLKLLPLDYEVSITSKGFSWFKNPDVEYWIVLDAALSKFGN
jgi:hypothetical protein